MWQVSDLMQLSPSPNKLGNYFLSSHRTCMRFTFPFEEYVTPACYSVICEHSCLRIPGFKALLIFSARMTSLCFVTNLLVKLSQPTPVRCMPAAVQGYGFDQTFKTRFASQNRRGSVVTNAAPFIALFLEHT